MADPFDPTQVNTALQQTMAAVTQNANLQNEILGQTAEDLRQLKIREQEENRYLAMRGEQIFDKVDAVTDNLQKIAAHPFGEIIGLWNEDYNQEFQRLEASKVQTEFQRLDNEARQIDQMRQTKTGLALLDLEAAQRRMALATQTGSAVTQTASGLMQVRNFVISDIDRAAAGMELEELEALRAAGRPDALHPEASNGDLVAAIQEKRKAKAAMEKAQADAAASQFSLNIKQKEHRDAVRREALETMSKVVFLSVLEGAEAAEREGDRFELNGVHFPLSLVREVWVERTDSAQKFRETQAREFARIEDLDLQFGLGQIELRRGLSALGFETTPAGFTDSTIHLDSVPDSMKADAAFVNQEFTRFEAEMRKLPEERNVDRAVFHLTNANERRKRLNEQVKTTIEETLPKDQQAPMKDYLQNGQFTTGDNARQWLVAGLNPQAMNPIQHPGYNNLSATIQDRYMQKLKDSGGITIEPGTGALQLSNAASGKKKNLDIMQEVLHELKQEGGNIHVKRASMNWWAKYTQEILTELTNPKSDNYNPLFEDLMQPDGSPSAAIRDPATGVWSAEQLMLELERRGRVNGVDLGSVYAGLLKDNTRLNDFAHRYLTPKHPSIAAINHEMFGDSPKSHLQSAIAAALATRTNAVRFVEAQEAGTLGDIAVFKEAQRQSLKDAAAPLTDSTNLADQFRSSVGQPFNPNRGR